jgi:hypothetical protein
MKRLLTLAGLAAALLAQPAYSAPWDYRPGLQQQDRRNAQRPPAPYGPDRRDQRAAPRRDDRHRLTDEERRDLRRDLDRANRELYRQKRQR